LLVFFSFTDLFIFLGEAVWLVVIIDNYDSFVYILYQYVCELGAEACVFRNDQCTVERIEGLNPSHIIISPGPCTPDESGISPGIVDYYSGRIPILGVCLGHQVIGQVFGWEVVRAGQPMHGKTSLVFHDNKHIYNDLPNPLTAARYHSLVVRPKTDHKKVIFVTARTADGEIMGIRHQKFTVEGVQFHPESILTNSGKKLLNNFLLLEGGLWNNGQATSDC